MWSILKLKILQRINPNLIWYLYAQKSKKIFKKSYFILSFDCDTEKDIEVVLDVHQKLQAIGITPVYAVPGDLLEKGEKIYQKIHQMGAEFINHGGRAHTYFDKINARHASCFFYDQQADDILTEDIILGHQMLQKILGVTAQGFRTPHFGTFQKSEQLDFLYQNLKALNYQFSTSTSPNMGYQYGPIYQKNGMIEIPVTGIVSEPLNIMDTWAYFAAPDRMKTPNDYLKTAQTLAQWMDSGPILINIYGDPSHIYNQPEFFEAMKCMVQYSNNINYRQLLMVAHENIRSI